MSRLFCLTSFSFYKNLNLFTFYRRIAVLVFLLPTFSCDMLEDVIGNNVEFQIEYSLRQPIKSSYAVGDTVIIDMHLKSLDGPCQRLTLSYNSLNEEGHHFDSKDLDEIVYDPMVTEWDYYYEYVIDTIPSYNKGELEIIPLRESQGNSYGGFGGSIELHFTIE